MKSVGGAMAGRDRSGSVPETLVRSVEIRRCSVRIVTFEIEERPRAQEPPLLLLSPTRALPEPRAAVPTAPRRADRAYLAILATAFVAWAALALAVVAAEGSVTQMAVVTTIPFFGTLACRYLGMRF